MHLDGPSWSLGRGSPLEREARGVAVRAAVTRSRDHATALGATLRDLLELADTDADADTDAGVGGMPRASATARGGGDAPPELDLEPQPHTASATATVTGPQGSS
ncbi:MAG: SIMPL domain-containing protein [Janthinobacterium lividum]